MAIAQALAAALAGPAVGECQPAQGSASDSAASSAPSLPLEQGGPWLPEFLERLDAREELDEPRLPARFRIVGGCRAESRSRAWGRLFASAPCALGTLEVAAAHQRRRPEGGAAIRRRWLTLAGGTVALSAFGLTGETAGLVRKTRAVGTSADLGPGIRAAAGEAADLVGGAVAAGTWLRLSAGRLRRRDGMAAALETKLGPLEARAVLVRDGPRREFAGGLAAERGDGRDGSAARGEFGAGPRGPFARLGIEAREGRLHGAARYQIEPWRDRPGLLDLEGSWSARGAGARVRWRSWSAAGAPRSATSAAAGPPDDGLVELDLRVGSLGRGEDAGAWGVWRVRLGSKPRQEDGAGGERFAAGEWTVARDRGRAFRLTAGWRDAQRGEGWRRGSSAGARFDWAAPRERAALTLSVEAVRAEGGGSSYGPALEVAEGGSLRARTRSGVRAAGRGWLRLGAWRLGAGADGEDDGTNEEETTTGARRATRATLWLAWSGDESAREARR